MFSMLVASLRLVPGDGVPTSKKVLEQQGDAEIRQKIIGTWIWDDSATPTNKHESLTYTTNGCYSAKATTVDAAKLMKIGVMASGLSRVVFLQIRSRIPPELRQDLL
jgi:hypothetical protein